MDTVYIVVRYVTDSATGQPIVGELNDIIGAYSTEDEAKKVRDFMRKNLSRIDLYPWFCMYAVRRVPLGKVVFESRSIN